MIAIALTVKNEARMLALNCEYHRALGVAHFYVIDDGSDDGCIHDIEGRPDITILTSEECRRALAGRSRYGIFEAHWHHELNARKGLNAHYAAELARDAGYEWLVSIDPDEFLFVDLAFVKDGLLEFLRRAPDGCEMVVFPNYEVMQSVEEDHPFWTNARFKSMYLLSDHEVVQSSFRRRVYNPLAKITWWVDGYYGHSSGKSAVRLRRSEWRWHPSGHWATDFSGSPLQAFDANDASGCTPGIAHFFCVDFESFLTKFRNYAETIPDRRINSRASLPTKMTWIAMVNSGRFSQDELRSYYQEWIAISDDAVRGAFEDPLGGGVVITSIRDGLLARGYTADPPCLDGSEGSASQVTALGSHFLLSWRRRLRGLGASWTR